MSTAANGLHSIAMNCGHLPDIELLAKLVGGIEAKRLYKGSLKPLFTEGFGIPMPEKCAVALELIRRLLLEELRSGSALTSPGAVRDYLKLILTDRKHEVFVCLWLDAQHRVIETEEAFKGTLTHTSVYPREIVKSALVANAAAVIFAHNHPSGVAQPSQADELLTRNLKEALALVEVKVLDHFIVAGRNTISFAERGLL